MKIKGRVACVYETERKSRQEQGIKGPNKREEKGQRGKRGAKVLV